MCTHLLTDYSIVYSYYMSKRNCFIIKLGVTIYIGTDPEINQGGGWLTFQARPFIYVVIVSITIESKFKDTKWEV